MDEGNGRAEDDSGQDPFRQVFEERQHDRLCQEHDEEHDDAVELGFHSSLQG